MSKSGSEPTLWVPRHSGWNLAHHLLPSFVLFAFLAGSGAYALLHARPVLSTAMLASAVAILMGVVAAYRRPTLNRGAGTAAVDTSTGARAATWFPMFRSSAKWAAAVMGLAVVILVATVALGARLLVARGEDTSILIVLLAVFLLVTGVYVLNRGLHMARISATAQEPGVYLTRSRIVLYDSRGTREIYWNDVADVKATDPARRKPLGKRGPAWIVVAQQPRSMQTSERLLILIHELTANPDQLLRTLEHYWANPEDRAELGTITSLGRVKDFTALN